MRKIATKFIEFQGQPQTRRRRMPLLPPLIDPCSCPVPVWCETDGNGELVQTCVRCGTANKVIRRTGEEGYR